MLSWSAVCAVLLGSSALVTLAIDVVVAFVCGG